MSTDRTPFATKLAARAAMEEAVENVRTIMAETGMSSREDRRAETFAGLTGQPIPAACEVPPELVAALTLAVPLFHLAESAAHLVEAAETIGKELGHIYQVLWDGGNND